MAAKIRMLKLLQEIRGLAQVTNRRPQPRSPGLMLVQMRSRVLQAAPVRRRLSIAMDTREHPDLPHPVKIKHRQPNPDSATRFTAA